MAGTHVEAQGATIGELVIAERVIFGGQEPSRLECAGIRDQIETRFDAAVRNGGLTTTAKTEIGEAFDRLLAKRVRWSDVAGSCLASIEVDADRIDELQLPFELLRPPDPVGSVVVRCAVAGTSAVEEKPRTRPEGGRIVLATADAGGPVPDAAVLEAIEEVCQAGLHRASGAVDDARRGAFDPVHDYRPRVSCEVLSEVLAPHGDRPGATVLQLVCHVRQGGLCLHDDGGREVVVGAEKFAALLADFSGHLRLVVLVPLTNSRDEDLGRVAVEVSVALHRRGMAAVVAPRVPLPESAVPSFTAAWLGALLGTAQQPPASLEVALVEARKSLITKGDNLGYLGVRLYARTDGGSDTRPLVIRPYRGLLAFEPEHQRFFVGRTDDASRVVKQFARLREQGQPSLVLLFGASGVGKSSLAKAGVVPRLAEQGDRPVFARSALHSIEELDGLLEDVEGERRVLVVDQLERVFFEGDPRQEFATTYLQRLWRLAERRDTAVLATLRIDALERGGGLPVDAREGRTLEQLVHGNHGIPIPHLQADEIRDAIVEPARAVGLTVDPGLVDRLCDEALFEPGALPMLELVLDHLWHQRRGHELVADAYEDGLGGTLAKYAEETLGEMSQQQRHQAERILVRVASGSVVEFSTWRRRSTVAALRPHREDRRADFEVALSQLIDARLVVRGELGASAGSRGTSGGMAETAEIVELAHELLLRQWDALQTWIARAAPRLPAIRDLEQWVDEWTKRNTLLTEAQLAYVDDKLSGEDDDLSEAMLGLIEASRRSSHRRRSLRQAGVLGACVAAAAFAGLSWWALDKRDEAIERARDEMGARASLLATAPGRALEALELGILAVGDPGSEGGARRYRGLHDALKATHQSWLLTGHQQAVLALDWGPDGRRLVSAGGDGTARIWNPSGAIELSSRRFEGPLVGSTWSPDGTRVALATATGIVEVWDESLTTRFLREYLGSPATTLEWSSDGEHIAVATANGELWTALVDDPSWSNRVRAELISVSSISWPADDRSLLVLDAEGALYGLDPWRGGLVPISPSVGGRIVYAAWSPDGSRVAVGIEAGDLRVLSSVHEPSITIDGNGHPAKNSEALAWSPDASRLAIAGTDGTVEIWSASTETIHSVAQGARASVNALSWSPDGTRLAIAGADGITRVTRGPTGRPAVELGRHRADVRALAWSPDGEMLATASDEGSIRIWSSTPVEPGVRLEGHTGAISAAAWAPDGSRVATASDDGGVSLWSATSGRLERELVRVIGPVEALAWEPDGSKIAVGGQDRHLRVLDSSTGELVYDRVGHEGSIAIVAWSPTGQTLASAGWDGTVTLWDAPTGTPGPLLRVGQGRASEVSSLSWSPRGRRLATLDLYGRMRVWDSLTGTTIEELTLSDEVSCLVWSRDGSVLVTGHEDGRISARSAANGHMIWQREVSQEPIAALEWSPADDSLAAGGVHGAVIALNAAKGTVLSRARGHSDRVIALAWDPSGEWFASASEGGAARLWAPGRQLELAEFVAHDGGTLALEWSPNGSQLITAGSDHVAWIWTVDPIMWSRRGCEILLDARRSRPMEEPTLRVCAALGSPGSIRWSR